jgi:hypothetical protein
LIDTEVQQIAPPTPPIWTYWWTLNPKNVVKCYKGGGSQAVTPKLWEAEAPTEVHDNVLMEVTEEINRVLAEASKKCPHADWELGLIAFQGRYMLAWTHPVLGGLGPHDDPRDVIKALHLRL